MYFNNSRKYKKESIFDDQPWFRRFVRKIIKKIPFASEVRTSSPLVISEMTESFLSLFDYIIYNLYDTGYMVKIKDIKVVERYINNGSSFLVTHDIMRF